MWKLALAVSVVAAMAPLHGAVIPGSSMSGRGVVRQPAASTTGTWTSETRPEWAERAGERRWQLNLQGESGSDHWGFGIDLAELQGLPAAATDGTASDVRFSWTREAGTFRFTGSFDGGRGTGRYVFVPNAGYQAAMQALGYTIADSELLRFAVLDVTSAYVRELSDAGYARLPIDDLTRMRIHRVSASEIREWRTLGLDGLSTDRLIRLRIHRVTPDFLRGLTSRGFRGLLADDLVKMRIHRVTLEEIDELRTLGFGGLDADELVKFRIHRVTPAFIREMRDVGFSAATDDQLVRMRIHRVDAQFVRDARADGYAMTTPGDAIDLAIRGPRFARVRRQ